MLFIATEADLRRFSLVGLLWALPVFEGRSQMEKLFSWSRMGPLPYTCPYSRDPRWPQIPSVSDLAIRP